MSDMMLSLIVIACAGAFIALIFLVAGKQKQKKVRMLASYCSSYGYTFNIKKEPLGTELRIEGEAFVLTSKMTSVRQEDHTGSSSWDRKTLWVTNGTQFDCPVFVLGNVSTSLSWEKMPEWMKAAVTEKAAHEFGIGYSTEAQPISVSEKMSLLLFEPVQGASRDAVERILLGLESWPASMKFIIRCDPSNISIQLNDCYIQDIAELDRVLRLGDACIG